MDLRQIVHNVTLARACNIKADKDSSEVKSITLKVKFDGSILEDVFNKALSGTVIQWQNGPGRKNFDTWIHKQVVEVDFKAPGRTADPETAMKAKLQSMSVEEREEYLKKLVESL